MTIYSLLKKKAVRKPIILNRAKKQEKRIIKLQAMIRGHLDRSSAGAAVRDALRKGKRKFQLQDPRYHAAKKIQRQYRKHAKKLKIKLALAKVKVDDPEMDELMKELDE